MDNNVKTSLKRIQYLLDKKQFTAPLYNIWLVHSCIYVLHKQKSKLQIQKLNMHLKNKINMNVYLFYVPDFQMQIVHSASTKF
jgi:hypothetical protein